MPGLTKKAITRIGDAVRNVESWEGQLSDQRRIGSVGSVTELFLARVTDATPDDDGLYAAEIVRSNPDEVDGVEVLAEIRLEGLNGETPTVDVIYGVRPAGNTPDGGFRRYTIIPGAPGPHLSKFAMCMDAEPEGDTHYYRGQLATFQEDGTWEHGGVEIRLVTTYQFYESDPDDDPTVLEYGHIYPIFDTGQDVDGYRIYAVDDRSLTLKGWSTATEVVCTNARSLEFLDGDPEVSDPADERHCIRLLNSGSIAPSVVIYPATHLRNGTVTIADQQHFAGRKVFMSNGTTTGIAVVGKLDFLTDGGAAAGDLPGDYDPDWSAESTGDGDYLLLTRTWFPGSAYVVYLSDVTTVGVGADIMPSPNNTVLGSAGWVYAGAGFAVADGTELYPGIDMVLPGGAEVVGGIVVDPGSGEIGTGEIEDEAVTTEKIADGAVTTEKLDPDLEIDGGTW